ncbi:MAG: DMT family transporter [SAR324 cluster bacterium]|nr:DMT family transporter [SAR324 cluster bacterium]
MTNSPIQKPNRWVGVPLVLTAGVFWSTSGLVYRLIEAATPWQVLFYRSAALSLALFLLLSIRYRSRMIRALMSCGQSAVIGGLCLATAFTGYLLALEHTSVANAMFILAVAPFSTALLGWLILKERVANYTWGCLIIAAIGLAIMSGKELSLGRGLGELFALLPALGFSGLTISLRIRQGTDLLLTIFIASSFATLFAVTGITMTGSGIILEARDLILSSGMGLFQLGLGFLLYTAGSSHLPAVELTLLSLTEIIVGPILVWIWVGEAPTRSSLMGGGLILGSIVMMALLGSVRTKDRN